MSRTQPLAAASPATLHMHIFPRVQETPSHFFVQEADPTFPALPLHLGLSSRS